MKAGWICNSAIGTTETFLVDNLKLLRTFCDVQAHCGMPSPSNSLPNVHYGEFDNIPWSFTRVLLRRAFKKDFRVMKKRKRSMKELLQPLQDFEADLLWIEYGTTAHNCADVIEKLNLPFFIAVHGYDISREFGDDWYRAEFVRIANKSSGVICASHHTKNLCIVAGVRPEQCHVVRLPIEPEKWVPEKTARNTHPSFVHMGRLVEKKGPIQTLLAFKEAKKSIPNATLTFIGDGPLRSSIESMIHDQGIGGVTLLGALAQDQAKEKVKEHHIFCQHSVTASNGDQEGFALSPAEAALLEMPVISTFHNGIPEHVIDGTTGVLVREWDIQGMSKAMVELAANPQRAEEMGKAGRQNILTLCDPSARSGALQSLFLSAL